MKGLANIGGLLKKVYRIYSNDLIVELESRGFTDLRPSFLEILNYLCEIEASSIKSIGIACGLKKQTMTSHLNELERRGYIERTTSEEDKREQNVALTQFGEKFKLHLKQSIELIESKYIDVIGETHMERTENVLELFHGKILQEKDPQQRLI